MTTKKFEASPATTLEAAKTTFKLEILKAGNAFIGRASAFGTQFHTSDNLAKTIEEVWSNYESFKNGFAKLQLLIAKGEIKEYLPSGETITFKEARILSGVHPAIISEYMGISQKFLKRLEDGEAKQGVVFDAALIHFELTKIPNMQLSHMDWSLKQKKDLSPGSEKSAK
ncbi:hypothetical protein [Planococcus sp. ISL-110]|uniref:hypothetical protein n=1 Tax=Planococcus sp. ISL-110 TaxID=2819167 RepID=UPI001BE504E3|nr:hypothetical protein [Planococcus sp. ISL-110]MBT2569849.1 hypothetical protein [Planococcus sp. ISL-110]